MPCETFRTKDGVVVACSRGSSAKRCKCGRPSTKLCDYLLYGELAGRTCDAPLCDRCAVSAGYNKDYCQAHARVEAKKGGA